jgi:diguanylate cyclase (GGDEF)-like protein/PAS domain S-box-containing protein
MPTKVDHTLHYQLMFTENKAVMLLIDPNDGAIIDASKGACQYYGYSLSELTSMSIFDINTMTKAEIIAEMQRAKEEVKNHFNLRHQLASGEVRDVEVFSSPIPVEGQKFLYSVIHDVTERVQVEKQLKQMAYFDSLTALPNRLLFFDRLEHGLAQAKRHSKQLALMFLDLDRFKQINDELGHDMGDIVLKETAQRLKESVRESDTVARIGGDEFAMILPDIRGPEDAIGVAEKLLQGMLEPFHLDGQKHIVGGSIGISLYPNDGIDSKVLLKNADLAMYQVKKQGRNDYGLYTNPLQREIDLQLTQ